MNRHIKLHPIGNERCKSYPPDGDINTGFRSTDLPGLNMADEQFSNLTCTQLKIELARRGAKISGRKHDMLQR